MIYALKLLLEVLVAGGLCAYLLRKPFSALLSAEEYRKAWITLLAGTTFAFLAHSPGLFLAGVGITAMFAASSIGRGPAGRLAVFALLALAMPPISFSLDGFGDINRLIVLNDIKLLSLLLLTGPALRLMARRRTEKANLFLPVDLAIFAYQTLVILLQFHTMSGTAIMRLVLEACIDTALPYYVLTRGVTTARDLRFVMSYFLLACIFAGAVALAEFALRRNIYTELEFVYGIRWQLTHTLFRNGLARVQAMHPAPIILAFVLTYGMGVWLWLKGTGERTLGYIGPLLAFWVAIVVTWSRGPLLGALCLVGCLYVLKHVSGRVFRGFLAAGLGVAIAAKVMHADQLVLAALATVFGGAEVDFGSIDYRSQLLDTALALIKQSPLFGVSDYQSQMQSLEQGEHIIDIVNTYIGVALSTGLVGLALFLFPLLYVLAKLTARIAARTRPESGSARVAGSRFARVFTSLIVSCLVTIFTTSTFGVMPMMLLFLVGVPLVWLRMSPAEQVLCESAAAVPQDAPALRPIMRL